MVYLEEPVHTCFPRLDDIYYSFMLKEDKVCVHKTPPV